jgi:hypothetical protein
MSFGNLLIKIGLIFVAFGIVLNYAPTLISWFGKLPGDIRIEDENKWVFLPITSMVIVSIILTIIVNLFFRK